MPPAAVWSLSSHLLSLAPELVSKIPAHPPPKVTAHGAQDIPQPPQLHKLLTCLQVIFHVLSATRPKAPSAFTAAVHDCAGVHRAHHTWALCQPLSGCKDCGGRRLRAAVPTAVASLLPACRHVSSNLLWPPRYQPKCPLQPAPSPLMPGTDMCTQPTGSVTAPCPKPQASPLHLDVPWCCAVQDEPHAAPANPH